MTDKWFFDTETGEVTQGKVTAWQNRMGPYDTKEEAANALERARLRNEEADSFDEED